MTIKKTLIGITTAFTIAVLGDHYNIENRVFGELYETIMPAEYGFYNNYTDLEIKYFRTNGKTEVFLYDRSTHRKEPIHSNMTAGTIDKMIDYLSREYLRELYRKGANRVRKGKNNLRDKFREFRYRMDIYKDILEHELKNKLK